MEHGRCPFSNYQLELLDDTKITKEISQNNNNGTSTDQNGMTYSQYLQLDKLLSCQKLLSEEDGNIVNDEHLFITTHQVYELWFKQINFEMDNIMAYLNNKIVDETKTLRIVSGLERIVRILKLLTDQMLILETMSPLDFVEFRKYLKSSSGFQSFQFRILENKLGIVSEGRINYNSQHYAVVFKNEHERAMVQSSEDASSLLNLVEKWLERTPGVQSSCGEPGFWSIYVNAVEKYLDDLKMKSEKNGLSIEASNEYHAEYIKIRDSFNSLIDAQQHNSYVSKGGRRLSHGAMKGALMIYFYREMPRFSQPYQILTYLMDMDSLLTKWRYNHIMLVQRMLGSKQGTGGSSGYMYLRSTISDRYKVFLDLFNLSTWLIPRAYIPALSPMMVKQLSDCSATEDDINSLHSDQYISSSSISE